MGTFDGNRRRFLGNFATVLGLGAAGRLRLPLLGGGVALQRPSRASESLHRKPIPGTDETVPSIGMGTYVTFNVGPDPDSREQLGEVLRIFFEEGGGMIDSSPMYGTAEEVLGDLLAERDDTSNLFSATKVWTRSTDEGEQQIDTSVDLWGVAHFDLMQIHNLVNWQGHMETLKARCEAGDVRYIGVTTSHGRRHDSLEAILRDEPVDFVQLTYNVVDREAENRLLPLAAERGIAVIANRPFRRGALFDRLGSEPLPDWAGDYGIDNWAQFFLKFITAHEAVTCVIPATSQPAHMRENMGALRGPLPDAATRQRMVRYVETL